MDDIRGWATFAWQADYGQFYLIDGDGADFHAPEEITTAMVEDSLAVLPSGLVVYTAGCLQQHIRIAIYAARPEQDPAQEPMWGKPWTHQRTVTAHFPSRRPAGRCFCSTARGSRSGSAGWNFRTPAMIAYRWNPM